MWRLRHPWLLRTVRAMTEPLKNIHALQPMLLLNRTGTRQPPADLRLPEPAANGSQALGASRPRPRRAKVGGAR